MGLENFTTCYFNQTLEALHSYDDFKLFNDIIVRIYNIYAHLYTKSKGLPLLQFGNPPDGWLVRTCCVSECRGFPPTN